MTPQVASDGIGATLKAERERRYISIDTVARSTHVRIEYLELIEAGRLDGLPSGTYAKGFIRSYASFLGLDPKPFVQAYEQSHGGGTEVRRIAPRRLHLPPDVQRRAWQVAVASAAGVLVLLGFLGVFGGEEAPAELPVAPALASENFTSPAPNPMGAVVRVDVIGESSWVEVIADGQLVLAETMEHGASTTFKGDDNVIVFVVRGDQVQFLANGQAVGGPEAGPYRGVFTRSTTSLPPNEPEATAEPGADDADGEAGPEGTADPARSTQDPEARSTQGPDAQSTQDPAV